MANVLCMMQKKNAPGERSVLFAFSIKTRKKRRSSERENEFYFIDISKEREFVESDASRDQALPFFGTEFKAGCFELCDHRRSARRELDPDLGFSISHERTFVSCRFRIIFGKAFNDGVDPRVELVFPSLLA